MLMRLLACVGSVAAAASALATDLNVNMTVDNYFTAYISTDDTVAGTPFLSSDNWQVSVSGSYAFPGAGTYYLHVAAGDQGGPRAFLGDFALTDAFGVFENGGQYLLTGPSNWLVSPTGFGADYITPFDYGVNGTGSWSYMTHIDPDSHWIWGTSTDPFAYFSTKIVIVPEPGAMALLAIAGLVAGVRRRHTVR